MREKIKNQSDYNELVDQMIEYDKLYYDTHKPEISDYEYDLLFKQLEEFEKSNPSLIHPESPTQRVSETLQKGFKKQEHITPMMSLANTYSQDELKDFINRVYKLTKKKELNFVCELKMDGIAVSLHYENKKLVKALTRGNGRIGDDVLLNVKTIKSLPLILKGENIPNFLEVRAEIYMSIEAFQKINEKREDKNLELWANPRNAAAGSLKLLNSKEVAKRNLQIACYTIAKGNPNKTQYETLQYLKKLNLPTSSEDHIAKCKNTSGIIAFSDKILEKRKKLFFEIDGIVVKVDDLFLYPKLGVTGKHPRYAAAYKYAPEQAETQIKEITVQVGRTGVLTPVAELKPVLLAGSTISRATLHNEDEIKKKDIRLNDYVIIEKGGDVIPKVISVVLKKRGENSKPWHMPRKCPACGTVITRRENEVAVRCVNTKCAAQRLRQLIFYASKQAHDIEHLGERVVTQLVEKGLVSRPSDFYLLDTNSLKKLEGFKEKSIKNLLNSIEKAKFCTLARFIMGLSIPFIGIETAELLANSFHTIENLIKASDDDLLSIEGIGEKMAESIVGHFKDPHVLEEIKLLLKHGVKIQKIKIDKDSSHPFFDKIFVITGTLDEFSRDEVKDKIKSKGGKVSSSVSKNTDYLILGADPGSKYSKAKKLNIPILTEEKFKKYI
jgi:DNA ligase (NAD+)